MVKGLLYLEWMRNREKVMTTMIIIVLLGTGLTVISHIGQLYSIPNFIMMYVYGWIVIWPFLVVIPLFFMLERDMKNRHIWLYTEASLRQLLNVKVLFLFLVSTVFIVFLCTIGWICEVIGQNGSLRSLLMPYMVLILITLFKVVVMQFLFLLIWSLYQTFTVYSQSLAMFVIPVSYVIAVILYFKFYDLLQIGALPTHISGIVVQREYEVISLFSLEKVFLGEVIAGILIITVSTFVSARFLEKKVGV